MPRLGFWHARGRKSGRPELCPIGQLLWWAQEESFLLFFWIVRCSNGLCASPAFGSLQDFHDPKQHDGFFLGLQKPWNEAPLPRATVEQSACCAGGAPLNPWAGFGGPTISQCRVYMKLVDQKITLGYLWDPKLYRPDR